MHGSGSEDWERSRHMWPVPDSTATTVAQTDSSDLDFFCKDGRKIQVGDTALFKPPQDSPPFIGIIRRLTLDKQDILSLGVNWLYRPADIRLAKGILLEAAPNEVFYSFHKDEIPAASLLHPCKVAFLRKGVELPSGISSFVCRRVYDIDHKRLWWLTDKDYINERQEEVDQLLDKTRLEMHGVVQSGGRSPKPLNGPSSTQQLKSGSDSVQNSASSFSSQAKGKKRDRVDPGSDSAKRERLSKTEDSDSGQYRPENMLKSEIAKITDKGGLVDSAGVERLVQLMQSDGGGDKKLDLAGRILLVDVISVTDRVECLGRFVQLRGLPVLDEWLQEVHKGKIGDGSSPKESDRSVEEFLLALLRALDKLPVNLHALQTCNVGKSVNYLRSHKNSEIQKKARSLVDTWKRRVEAEMNMNDAKSGGGRGVSWQNKPAPSEVSHVGVKKQANSAEVGAKSNIGQPSISKPHQLKLGDAIPKPNTPPGLAKPMSPSVVSMSKDQNFRMLVGATSSGLPLTPIKEEKSSSSSQSLNNSQSSDHTKTMGSSCREDARSSTAGSVSGNKVTSCASRHRKSSNGLHGSAVSAFPKERVSTPPSRSFPSERPLSTGATQEKSGDVATPNDQGASRLIVRFPNAGRSPARVASGVSSEDPISPPVEKHDNHHDKRAKTRNDTVRANVSADSDICSKDGGFDEDNTLPGEDGEKATEMSKVVGALSKIMSRSGKSYDPSFSPINALIESCAKISQASASASPGDDMGMNLLASVAAGEISKSENLSPSGSPGGNSSTPEASSSGNDAKLKQTREDVARQPSDGGALSEHSNAGDSLHTTKNGSRHQVSGEHVNDSGDSKAASPTFGERTGECTVNVAASTSSDPKVNEQRDPTPNLPTCSKVEGHGLSDGTYQFHEQRKFGVQRTKSISVPDSKLNMRVLASDEEKKTDCAADEQTMENSVPTVSEVASVSAKTEKDNEKSTCSSSDMGGEDRSADKDLRSDVQTDQNQSLDVKSEGPPLASGSGNTSDAAVKGERADEVKGERLDRQTGDLCSSASANGNDAAPESLEIKEPVVQASAESPTAADGFESSEAEEKPRCSAPSSSGPDASVKLDFDLNEGFPVEDLNHGEVLKTGPDPAFHLPCPFPFQNSSVSASFPASITIAAPAKGPFYPPDNPLRTKGELGWKGSAATSAFRPAEPRKSIDVVDSTASKPSRAPLDFDLNIADGLDDEEESVPSDRGAGGLDLDLNRIDENLDVVPFAATIHSRLEMNPLQTRPSLSMSGANNNVSRDFDLNNGPGLDEVGAEAAPRIQPIKSGMPMAGPVPSLRVNNNPEFGSFSSWFSPGNSFSAITVPPIYSSRAEQSYVPPPMGSQRVLCPPSVTTSYNNHEMYRGPVLSSSPAVPFPSTAQMPYPGFPFETGFPLSSNSFSGAPYMDSSSGGPLCFPMASPLVGPAGMVPSAYPRPTFVMNLPGGASSVGPDGRKWGGPAGLDLNSGPGGVEMERRDERLRQIPVPSSQALVEEHLKMFQLGGGVLKRKEPDGGHDGVDRMSYKQHSWQ